jgi:oxalate decarboxylase/phosphoglucose isomerase-like protein (cupin superfamily)
MAWGICERSKVMPKERYFIEADDVETLTFDWGKISIMVSPEASGAQAFSAGIVVMEPKGGHSRHNHPGAEEIIHVISGRGTQMVEDKNGVPITREIGPGSSVYVPASRYHSTVNTGSETMTVYVVYSPVGSEKILRTLPGCQIFPARR